MRRFAVLLCTVLAVVAVALCFCGCATSHVIPERFARYRPDVGVAFSGKGIDAVSTGAGAKTNAATGYARDLKSGDRVAIYLRDIPVPDVIKDVLDENGAVNMPLIGVVRLKGLSTSRAEETLEKAYIDGGYYKKINVIVVAEEDEYYVSGEVKRPGKYSLAGELRLLQAIAAAGGPTDFARLKKVKIIRNNQTMEYDCMKIEKGDDPDPQIKPGDLIKVETKGPFG